MASKNRVAVALGGVLLGFAGGVLVGKQPGLDGQAIGRHDAEVGTVECPSRNSEFRVRWADRELGSDLLDCDFMMVEHFERGTSDLTCVDALLPFIDDLRDECPSERRNGPEIDLDCAEEFFEGFTYPITLPD